MIRAISAKEGYKTLKARGLDAFDDCQRTFFAIDDENQEVYEFDTKIERDNFVRRHEG